MFQSPKFAHLEPFAHCHFFLFITPDNRREHSAECRIRLRCKVFDISVPLVNNTLKLYIEYSFARYYKASNSTLMYLLTAYSSKQIHQSQIGRSALSLISALDQKTLARPTSRHGFTQYFVQSLGFLRNVESGILMRLSRFPFLEGPSGSGFTKWAPLRPLLLVLV